jgi:Domain of unknown function DUF11
VTADPTTHDVYLVDPTYNTVSVFDESGDANRGRVMARIDAGGEPQMAAVDPGNGNVYVGNYSSNTVSVIAPPADLAVTVIRSPAASPFSVTVTVADHGPLAARATTKQVPAGLTVISTPGDSTDHGTLVWASRDLTPGASVTYDLTVAVAGGIHATVELGGVTTAAATYDLDHADNTAFLTLRLG